MSEGRKAGKFLLWLIRQWEEGALAEAAPFPKLGPLSISTSIGAGAAFQGEGTLLGAW